MAILCANPLAQFQEQQQEIEEVVLRVLRSGQYVLGNENKQFETEFASFLGVNEAVAVSNGTDALVLALKSLELEPTDEVITVSHTAVATVAAVVNAGAIPVLVDVDDTYFTLDVDQVKKAITKNTRAVIAVHIYGQSAPLNALLKLCNEYNIKLIEDVSQAHGATYHGKFLGTFGHLGCFSCYPTKNLGALGDSGVIVGNDAIAMESVRIGREYGWKQRYVSETVGQNSRMDEIQAAILRVKLKGLGSSIERRREIANTYSEALSDIYRTPKVRQNTAHAFHLYVLQVSDRSNLMAHLESDGIRCGIHYPVPVHKQPAYQRNVHTPFPLKVTEQLCKDVISLPLYPGLDDKDVSSVVDSLKRYASH